MADVPRFDDGQGAQIIWSDWSAPSVSRFWAWVIAGIGVLIVLMGAALFSPDVTHGAIGASANFFG